MEIVCLDLEGVLVPEIWINVAERTGIEELRATTRDISDYGVLMAQRLRLLDRHGLKMADIQAVIDSMGPLEGAEEFVDWLRRRYQVVILTDSFYEFIQPLMRQFKWPTVFCHRLRVDGGGRVTGYRLRMQNHKREAVEAFQNLNFKVVAVGDSYNDTAMLEEADAGILFRAPDNVAEEFPHFPLVGGYPELRQRIGVECERFRDEHIL